MQTYPGGCRCRRLQILEAANVGGSRNSRRLMQEPADVSMTKCTVYLVIRRKRHKRKLRNY
jgi:ribosomal protein L20